MEPNRKTPCSASTTVTGPFCPALGHSVGPLSSAALWSCPCRAAPCHGARRKPLDGHLVKVMSTQKQHSDLVWSPFGKGNRSVPVHQFPECPCVPEFILLPSLSFCLGGAGEVMSTSSPSGPTLGCPSDTEETSHCPSAHDTSVWKQACCPAGVCPLALRPLPFSSMSWIWKRCCNCPLGLVLPAQSLWPGLSPRDQEAVHVGSFWGPSQHTSHTEPQVRPGGPGVRRSGGPGMRRSGSPRVRRSGGPQATVLRGERGFCNAQSRGSQKTTEEPTPMQKQRAFIRASSSSSSYLHRSSCEMLEKESREVAKWSKGFPDTFFHLDSPNVHILPHVCQPFLSACRYTHMHTHLHMYTRMCTHTYMPIYNPQ
nr:mitogen-activated protein kinase 9 isoform X8 [Manis javanica]